MDEPITEKELRGSRSDQGSAIENKTQSKTAASSRAPNYDYPSSENRNQELSRIKIKKS